MEDIPDQAYERFVTKREYSLGDAASRALLLSMQSYYSMVSTKQRKCAVQSKRMLNNLWRYKALVVCCSTYEWQQDINSPSCLHLMTLKGPLFLSKMCPTSVH
ncbi:hypothetical protein NC652_011582 [Populus alba x Populus x berolinensis]|nr:hypothetical protein NC652_011582 [Populus alba x Populus x berolinensis]